MKRLPSALKPDLTPLDAAFAAEVAADLAVLAAAEATFRGVP